MAEYNQIVEGLYLGSYHGLYKADWKSLGITHIISVTPEDETPITPACGHTRIPMTFKMTTEDLLSAIHQAADLIKDLLDKGNIIYLHCYEGVSRSALCSIIYLHKFKDITKSNAHIFVKSKRPALNLNERMLECLSAFTTVSHNDYYGPQGRTRPP